MDGLDSYTWAFDANSNFTGAEITFTSPSYNEVITFTTTTHKNQLASFTTSQGVVRNYTYDLNGQTRQVTNGGSTVLDLVYTRGNGKARSIARPLTNVESVFDYDPTNARVRKRIYDTSSTPVLTHTTTSILGRDRR